MISQFLLTCHGWMRRACEGALDCVMSQVSDKGPSRWDTPAVNSRLGKDPDAGKDWGQKEKGTAEDEMVGWHHRLKELEFEQAPGGGGTGKPMQSMGSQSRTWLWDGRTTKEWCGRVSWAWRQGEIAQGSQVGVRAPLQESRGSGEKRSGLRGN